MAISWDHLSSRTTLSPEYWRQWEVSACCEIFEKIVSRKPEVASWFGPIVDEEVEAVRIISKRSLNFTPSSMHGAISCVQKESWNGLPLWFVKQVNCAQWIHHLTDLYIDLGQYEFTLNPCSMFTLDSRCMYHSLPAPKILLPSHRTKSEPPEQETASVGHAENMGTSLCKRVRGNETHSNYG